MYALNDAIKGLDWYAFSRTPKDVAERVAGICEVSESHADNTDYTRLDGSVGSNARLLERTVLLAVFRHVFHVELLRLMKSQTGLSAATKHGVKYNTHLARASGSPETSPLNTILNAFVAFLGFRMTRKGGSFMDMHEAWDALGIYGGDDGLTADQDGKAAEKAALMMGLKLTL